jgi:type II secretory pathway pseudopilin PulG
MVKMKNYFFKNKIFGQHSFTLIETLVAIAIFIVLSVATVELFTNSINTQTSILQNQQLVNESGYAMEYMHRILRMAHRDDDTTPGNLNNGGSCVTENTTFGGDGASTDIYFIGYDYSLSAYRCMRIYLDSATHKVKIQISPNFTASGAQSATAVELTSSQIYVNKLQYYVSGDTIGTNQPKITILMDIQSNTKRVNPIPRMVLQTTASLRNLNVE